MKSIKLSTKQFSNLHNQPLIAVVGSNQQYKSRLLNEILTSQAFYSKKFGRILYIGQRRYKSQLIVQDHSNWRQRAQYQQIMDLFDQAKRDGIVNLLIVFNTKNIKEYSEIIQKILGLRFNFLQGIISIIVNLSEIYQLKKEVLSSFNTFFCFESDLQITKAICQILKINQELQQKRKKDVYIMGLNKAIVYKDIKD